MKDINLSEAMVYNFAKVQLSGMSWMPSRVEKRGDGDRCEQKTQNRFWMRWKDKGA